MHSRHQSVGDCWRRRRPLLVVVVFLSLGAGVAVAGTGSSSRGGVLSVKGGGDEGLRGGRSSSLDGIWRLADDDIR